MRILYLTHRLPYAPNRGDRIRAYYMLRHLAVNHRVDLVSFVHDAAEESHAGSLADLCESATTARISTRRKVVRGAAALLHQGTLTHALLDAPGFRRRLRDVVTRNVPDLVIAYCSGMARFALEAPLDRVPFVLDMVDVDSQKWAQLALAGRTPKHWIYRREAALLSAFEREAARAACATLVVNERERQTLARIGVSSRVEVVPNGVDLAGLRPETMPVEEPRVVFCGVMNYEPNESGALWLMQKVWPIVRHARPEATLAIVGANPTERLRKAGREDTSIEVTGSVPDVRPFLWKSAVSVAPLFVARGLQNKVLEATAAGLPSIVTSPVFEGLPPEVVPACGRADSPETFAASVIRLLALNAKERRTMADAADLERLDWPHQLAPLDQILADARRPARKTA
jgi:sugar transferase (PEP-CTERM/EpsH1 system associated)